MERVPFSYSSPWTDSLRAEGEARGAAKYKAEAIVAFLKARGVLVPHTVRDRITACADLDQLDRWIERAATVTSADQLFDD
ncbi:hypothetical protein LO762_04660 [Actinocorallia sp. API 0066]|uniref:hypothetical protein n=1 Tax=Actinocorallia sp. API 0066 TaxID=2896846 RepID=UPI001E3CE5CF|nr:hypothetical protein [Actinocorallia sp. API 0066]MCD0448489.1 hypothetical protein [Actinocorallia sp. API 0066]